MREPEIVVPPLTPFTVDGRVDVERGAHGRVLGGQQPGRLVGEERGQLGRDAPELGRRGVGGPQPGDAVGDERVVDDGQRHGVTLGRGISCGGRG